LFGWIFWVSFFKLAKLPPQQSPVIARLMNRNYLTGLKLYTEKNFFLGGIAVHAGYKQLPYSVDKKDKKSTSYSVFRRLSMAVNALTAFTAVPLLVLSILGLCMAGAGLLMFADILLKKLTGKVLLLGWSSLMASIWLLFGVLTTSISVVGLYIVKIYEEVKGRPRYLVKSIFSQAEND